MIDLGRLRRVDIDFFAERESVFSLLYVCVERGKVDGRSECQLLLAADF
jgi:hypothetical protein